MASKHQRILILDGHPDGGGRRFIHALAEAWARGARVLVTMGMPALFYRWYYRAHGVA